MLWMSVSERVLCVTGRYLTHGGKSLWTCPLYIFPERWWAPRLVIRITQIVICITDSGDPGMLCIT